MKRRVVITGLGVVSAIGSGALPFWEALINGTSGIGEITAFDTTGYPTHRGGQIKGFDPRQYLSVRCVSRMGRASHLAVSAAQQAFVDAELAQPLRRTAGLCFGSTMGESAVLQELDEAWLAAGFAGLDPAKVRQCPVSTIAAHCMAECRLRGPVRVITNACAAGNFALGAAFDLIRSGEAEVMLAGGADAFSRIAFTGFNRMLAVAPQKCQPFDKNRKGMMVAEGAAFFVLESQAHAAARGKRAYAEVLGYGISCDAHHMSAPHHRGIAAALQGALDAAGITCGDVDYISAHGTGTPANDREECLALRSVFADSSRRIPVSSIKSMLGHTMGAASAIETVACCMAIAHGVVPPTVNFETPDPDCDIDCVPNVARRMRVRVALNTASAFGGNNACVALAEAA